MSVFYAYLFVLVHRLYSTEEPILLLKPARATFYSSRSSNWNPLKQRQRFHAHGRRYVQQPTGNSLMENTGART